MKAFVFPGQGAQFKGMVKDVCTENSSLNELILKAQTVTGEAISDLLWETELYLLSRSDKSQLAITISSLILVEALKQKNIECDVCAGFSLGEFPALCVSGVLSFEDTIAVVQKRGQIMQVVCDELTLTSNGNPPGMAAVIGLTPENVKETIKPLTEEGVAFAANLNSPKQTVISGTSEGLSKAEMLLKEAGARRVIRLKVAGPFHSPLMQKAAEEFEKVLKSVVFNNPTKILLSNVTGQQVSSGEEAKKLAVLHLVQSVQWTKEESELNSLFGKSSDNSIYEVGPGSVLTGLWRDSGFAENLPCIPCGTLEQLNSIGK